MAADSGPAGGAAPGENDLQISQLALLFGQQPACVSLCLHSSVANLILGAKPFQRGRQAHKLGGWLADRAAGCFVIPTVAQHLKPLQEKQPAST